MAQAQGRPNRRRIPLRQGFGGQGGGREMSEQLTKEQAIALAESKFWEPMTMRQRAEFQISQDRLCMPFSVYHEAMTEALGRPVYTHEFAFRDLLRKELLGELPKPTMQQIIELIPENKRIVVQT
jgi:hypothetical protein